MAIRDSEPCGRGRIARRRQSTPEQSAVPVCRRIARRDSGDSPIWRPLVFVDLRTGLRWGELVAVRWTAAHLESGKLSVSQNIPVGERNPGSPKGGAQRVVDLFPQVVHALMDLPQRGDLVFPGARGGRLNYRWFRSQIWEPSMEQAGLQLTFHDLRHAYASLMLAFGYTVLYVSQQLGHSSAKVTLDTYGMSWRKGACWTGRPRYGSSRKSSAVLRGCYEKRSRQIR